MRLLFVVGMLAMTFGGCSLTAPVEQTSKAPLAEVPAFARGKEVTKVCAELGKTDNMLCKGMDKVGKKKAEGAEH